MAKRKRKRPATREESAFHLLKNPKLAKKRRYRARWRPHEITYW
jgi:hypothetical protein